MSVVMLSDSDMSVAGSGGSSGSGGGDGEVDCSLARPPPPLHAHPPPPTIGLDDEDVMVGVGGCDVERVSPSQVTAVSSDTHSSSPDTQTGNHFVPPSVSPANTNLTLSLI
ncbi:hypothetical protein Pmani_031502 [Petrolisthes manimaculis]|uniref:Uncharacterized protein n=1 Tax=Petrolisthes manimaculis TaxID=1843537 RepID=A0AAE1TSK3_9EUCA|nr:hypothetical protein Pmani_031502 [Petrolisthes manimaculis]